MPLSTKTKEAIETALAMTISYGIALQMDWEDPRWAGYAVASISLTTVGQSFNKAAMRMFGTLMTAAVALTLIALFPQERWLFMLFLSIYIGFCTYMMAGPKIKYFWHVCGFVCIIICMTGGANAVNAFETAVLRIEETGLGILVYSLVSILLWPTSSKSDFTAAASNLASAHHQLYRAYFELMTGAGDAQKAQALKAQVVQELARFNQLLDAAETDTYGVWELRQQWRLYKGHAVKLTETLGRWHESFEEMQALDIKLLFPDFEAFNKELDSRFAQMERMLADQEPDQQPASIELELDKAEVRELPHFQRAAVTVCRKWLHNLERLTRFQFANISDVKGYYSEICLPEPTPTPRSGFTLDPDRLLSASQIILLLWLLFIAVIYVESIPGGLGILSMAGAFGMALAVMPQVPVTMLFVPSVVSVLFASLIYIFVMPQLSSFLGLGILIFSVTFAICYLFAGPRQSLSRAIGLAIFVTIIGVSNQQAYSFMSVAITALMFVVLFFVMSITAYIPFSPHPEKAFLRLLGRYFRSCEYLLSTMSSDQQFSNWRLAVLRKNFHLHEVSSLPVKLGGWARFIDTKILPGTSAPQIQAVVASLQGLSSQMSQLLEEGNTHQSQILVQELKIDIRAWRLKVKKTFQKLTVEPIVGEEEAFRTKLADLMVHMETRIKQTLDKAPEGKLSAQDSENFYSLLGAYRGVSEAVVDYARSASVIDWARWREERF